MCDRAEGLGGEPTGDGPTTRPGCHFRWTQDSLYIGSTLDKFTIDDL